MALIYTIRPYDIRDLTEEGWDIVRQDPHARHVEYFPETSQARLIQTYHIGVPWENYEHKAKLFLLRGFRVIDFEPKQVFRQQIEEALGRPLLEGASGIRLDLRTGEMEDIGRLGGIPRTYEPASNIRAKVQLYLVKFVVEEYMSNEELYRSLLASSGR